MSTIFCVVNAILLLKAVELLKIAESIEEISNLSFFIGEWSVITIMLVFVDILNVVKLIKFGKK